MTTQIQADELIRNATSDNFEIGAMENTAEVHKAFMYFFECGTVMAVNKATGDVSTPIRVHF